MSLWAPLESSNDADWGYEEFIGNSYAGLIHKKTVTARCTKEGVQ
jgi:hypothetical protein